MTNKKPHILIFNPDQWRGDVMGHIGNRAAVTPSLDSIVETDAVSFTNAFCQNPVCTPSRCSFMTGWYPHVRGHRTMFHMLQPDEPMLLRDLIECPELTLLNPPNNPDQELHGLFASDLLSHVMGNAHEGDVLITVLSNINVLGVASLLDLSAVVFTHNAELPENVLRKAEILGLALFRTKLPTAETVILLHKLGV